MTVDRERILERLRRCDGAIAASGQATLAPDRDRSTPLAGLAERVLSGPLDDTHAAALLAGLATVVEAQRDAFPENLLFDYDYLVASLVRTAESDARGPGAWLDEALPLLVRLQELFGRNTPIRFRYVHDFAYGFDWAKWVRRDPEARARIGPFDLEFLRATWERGQQLLALIDGDDSKYHRLRDARPRNPFPFSREPDAELTLHRDLAARGLLPVEAWRWDATPTWDRPYADLRVERATALSLT